MKLPKSFTVRTSQTVTVPAPIGGWNARDPLPEMKPTDAVILDNMFCLPTELQIRKGYSEWATGIAGTCASFLDYDAPTGDEELFVASNNAGVCQIYDVTASGAVGAAVVSGLTSAQFRHASFTNSGGSFMFAVNGADSLMIYDGTTWNVVTGVSAPYAITGVTTSTLTDVIAHKRRVWFVQEASLSCWYLATDAISGAATKFDFGPVFQRGGHIVKIATWTLDAGYGVDDHFCIFTNTGEVAIYRGTDPASSVSWSLVGVFYIGSPVTQTAAPVAKTCKYGGDLLIVNRDGIAQMSKSLMSSRVSTHLQMTDKIQPQLAQDTSSFGSNEGWDILLYPPQNMLVVNIPINATESYQYVMNTISGGWARWTDIPAKCMYFANETLYAGTTTGKVLKLWDTQADNGTDVVATILPAYSKFGNTSTLKRWSMARVIMGLTATASYGFSLLVDFNKNTNVLTLPATVPETVGVWDVSTWDNAVWAGNIFVERKWQTVSGLGYWGSAQIQIETSQSDIRMYSIDYIVSAGQGVF